MAYKRTLMIFTGLLLIMGLSSCASESKPRPPVPELKKMLIKAEDSLGEKEMDESVTCLAEVLYGSAISDKTLNALVDSDGEKLMDPLESYSDFEQQVLTSNKFVTRNQDCMALAIPEKESPAVTPQDPEKGTAPTNDPSKGVKENPAK